MIEKSISVTEAARNFADCVNRAHYQNITFVLLKNGLPFARLTPDTEKVCSGRDLGEALASVELSAADAKEWHRDLLTVPRGLARPNDRCIFSPS